jgi:DNA-binding winged helix-turn-helix (wHTH) protein
MFAKHFYAFGPYRLDLLTQRLIREAEPIPLTPKAFDTLVVLVMNRERLVEKGELMKRLWPDSFVEEANLSQQIFTLRRILGEQPDGHPYIETLPRRGYRFAAEAQEVRELEEVTTAAPPADGSGPRARSISRTVLALSLLGIVVTGTLIAMMARASRARSTLDLSRKFADRFKEGSDLGPSRAETSSIESYHAFAEARVLYSAGAYEDVLKTLARAVAIDPDYARAWALMSKAYSRLTAPTTAQGGSPEEYHRLALQGARRAVELDPSLYDAHAALALASREAGLVVPWRAEARTAIKLNARLAEAYVLLADSFFAAPGWGCPRDRDFEPAERTAISCTTSCGPLGPRRLSKSWNAASMSCPTMPYSFAPGRIRWNA